jgi:Cutinase
MEHKAEAPLEQSCDIADISQSSGRPFNLAKAMEIKKSYPASAATCIESYYYKLNLPVPEGLVQTMKPPAGYNPKGSAPKASSSEREVVQEPETVQARVEKRQSCKEYALFWARGSLEPASTNNLGITIGPTVQTAINKAMPGKWHTQGIQYPAALADNFCVGLPGGYNCVQQLTKYHESCPNTKVALAGYSQGGMVVRNCAAFVSDSLRSKIIVR